MWSADGFHKSSYSDSGSHCVEARETVESVDVRDTQNRDCGHLSFPVAEWRAFLADVDEL
ncbi:hypothetical protein GCM10023224_02990 [Streptomonospora halophila]|uniref:DUF397 domain-containing protein n=1 Tax=Streptomonospora halophila TaxID=427369 RepID=A0ABP9G4A2_9ACTN